VTIAARGLQGQMYFDGQNVVIRRRGIIPFLMHGAKGTKTIPLRAITAVQHRRCLFVHGYLQLSVSGELDRSNNGKDGPISRDENAVVFYLRANRSFQTFADTLRDAISDVAAGRPVSIPGAATDSPPPMGPAIPIYAAAPMVASAPARSIFEQVEDLGRLRDAGHISIHDFQAKKAELLARI
jgi:hypothetical protein